MPMRTMFDRFPNELLYEVFEYLTIYDILYAFQGINKRINKLLNNYDKYNLNFQSWPKSKFDFVRQSISPEQIQSLILSDTNDTVRQIHLFFRSFYIRRCINLKLLTLNEISELDWIKIARKLHYLPKLTSLSIQSSHQLSPITTELPLKYLTLGLCPVRNLHQWLVHTPMLRKIEVQLFAEVSNTGDIFSMNPMDLNICQLILKLPEKSNVTFDELDTLFACMSKLEVLTVCAKKGFRLVNGDRWENLIRRHLPSLKYFHFKIHPSLDSVNTIQLFAPFQTSFWSDQHQWFIHCDYDETMNSAFHTIKNIHLYTLPYCDEEFYLSTSIQSLTKLKKDVYQTIKKLRLVINCEYHSHILQQYYFPNLNSLTIQNLFVFIPLIGFIDLSQIKHLTIEKSNTISSEQFFSEILTYSINLHSLQVPWQTLREITGDFTNQHVCSLLTKQIKCLHISQSLSKIEQNKCQAIINLIKIFSINLEKLNVSVRSLHDVPYY
ncbi:hypothetical protein I4U23_015391 [Adineta vaga]|nr:hypothetical protein I4U23_015391 [Adineta vaga]